MEAILLGIDVGSSACKVIALGEKGRLLGRGEAGYPTSHPRAGWAEVNPGDWYAAARQAVRMCLASGQVDPENIAAVAVDGPAHNVALLDEAGQSVRPALHWSDLRSLAESEALQETHGELIARQTLQRPNPSWTLSQLAWVREREPESWRRIRRILVTKDYVRSRLTGDYATDAYDAIGTQLFDVAQKRWSPELCGLLGLSPAALPVVRPPFEVAGRVVPAAAADFGLRPGTPVIVGSGDSVVEAAGVGALEPGDCVVKLGTAANVNVVTTEPLRDSHAIIYPHVSEGHWFAITATNSGTATMKWFREGFLGTDLEPVGNVGEADDPHAQIDALARSSEPGARGLLFFPFLKGERSPYWNPRLRGAFGGISAVHGRADFAMAVLEGVAFSLRACLESIRATARPRRYILIGGGSKSSLWRQCVSNVLGETLECPPFDDAAVGSALLAGIAIGVFDGWIEARSRLRVGPTKLVEPDPSLRNLYDALFGIYEDSVVSIDRLSSCLLEVVGKNRKEHDR